MLLFMRKYNIVFCCTLKVVDVEEFSDPVFISLFKGYVFSNRTFFLLGLK